MNSLLRTDMHNNLSFYVGFEHKLKLILNVMSQASHRIPNSGEQAHENERLGTNITDTQLHKVISKFSSLEDYLE